MDTLKSIWEDLNHRLKSPFVVSFLLSWIIWNWILVYSVFNFEKDCSLDYRVNYIKEYIHLHSWSILVFPLVTSFFAALFFYFCKTVFLALDTLYENRLRVKAIKWIGMETMVPISDLNKYVKEIDIYKKHTEEKASLYATSQTDLGQARSQLIAKQTDFDNFLKLNPPSDAFQNLEFILQGTWYCEFNWIKDGEFRYGAELFHIDGDKYVIEDREGFRIDSIKFDRRTDLLSFSKIKANNDMNTVRLLKIDDNLWSGIEIMQGGYLSYIRLYSQRAKPGNILIGLNKEQVHTVNIPTKDTKGLREILTAV